MNLIKNLKLKTKNLRVQRTLLLTLYTAILMLPVTAGAEGSPIKISISPAISEYRLDPGEEGSQEINVNNPSDKTIALRVYVQNFLSSDFYGGLSFNNEESGDYTAKNWILLDKQNMVVEPGKTTKLRYRVVVPENAEPGDHYGIIFFETISHNDPFSESAIGINGRVGALQLITVSGEILEKGKVLGAVSSEKCTGVQCSFRTDFLRNWGPVPFEFKFENTGNIHTKVSGKIEIFNILGMKVGEVPIAEENILAGGTKIFEEKWLREPLFGYYKAKLTVVYGSMQVQDRAVVRFIGFPWIFCLPFAGMVLSYTAIRKIRKRNRVRSLVYREKHIDTNSS